jgi:hypothetical protein
MPVVCINYYANTPILFLNNHAYKMEYGEIQDHSIHNENLNKVKSLLQHALVIKIEIE